MFILIALIGLSKLALKSVASLRGSGWDRSRSPTFVQSSDPSGISANPLKIYFFTYGGSHVCTVVTFTADEQRNMVRTPTFLGLASGDTTD